MNKLQKSTLAAAMVASALASAAPAYARCRGFVCDLVKDVPVVGTVAQGGDAYIAEMKKRGSSADVLNQATTFETWNNPVGQPYANAPPPPPPQFGSRCMTQGGWQWAPQLAPVGTPCAAIAYGYGGQPMQVYGQIVP